MAVVRSTGGAVLTKDFEGHNIRHGGTSDRPWFVAMDVCAALGIQWKAGDTLTGLDDDQRGVEKVVDATGVRRQTAVVYESGLYELIFRSNKPEAKAFRRWVTDVVLPTIRKTGAYVVDKRRQRYLSSGKDGEWIDARTEGIQARRGFTDILKDHGVNGAGYALVTNATYKGLFNASATGLREQLGLPSKVNIRDSLPLKDLVQVSFSEILTGEVLDNRQLQGNNQAVDAAYEVAAAVKSTALRLTQS